MARKQYRLGILAVLSLTFVLYLLLPDNAHTLQNSKVAKEIVANLKQIGSSLSTRAFCVTTACFDLPSMSSKEFYETVFHICLSSETESIVSDARSPDTRIHIVVVACGDRLEESLVNIKSILLFTKDRIVFHIFAEDDLHDGFRKGIEEWPEDFHRNLQYKLYPITYPHDGNTDNWKKLFKPCASQRLFLPLVLDHSVDSILYVDTDILFISNVREFWDFFHEYNSSQLASLCIEHEDKRIGWYNRFGRHPYYGVTGVNSGVMLMNLTRIREALFKNNLIQGRIKWGEMLLPLYEKYRYNITWGDQDLLNIIFHFNPEMLHIFTCKWNYRPDHCMYGQTCKSAKTDGVRTVHGSRRVYHTDKQPAFKAIYDTLKELNFQNDRWTHLYKVMEQKLMRTNSTYCGKEYRSILKGLNDTMQGDWKGELYP